MAAKFLNIVQRGIRRIPIGLLKYGTGVVENFPKLSLCVIFLSTSPLIDHCLYKRALRELEHPILHCLETGSRPPPLPYSSVSIDRQPVKESLLEVIKDSRSNVAADDHSFQIVLGPSGTGKTLLTRQVCNEITLGVLYHEIYEPAEIGKELANACGLKLGPSGVLDLMLSYIPGGRYIHYHVLPESRATAIGYVLDKLAKETVTFKKQHSFVPCLFIDGVDLLAKEDPSAFVKLVDRAKHLSNSNSLKIILVSSEGKILPLIRTTSSISRAARVMEILDVPDEDAVRFLSTHMPEDIAKAVAEVTGGRFVHLQQACGIYMSEKKSNFDQKTVINSIKKSLVNRNVNEPLVQVLKYAHFDLSKDIMRCVLSEGSVRHEDIITKLSEQLAIDRNLSTTVKHAATLNVKNNMVMAEVSEAIEQLVSVNLLRYQANGDITCHNRLVSKYLKDKL